MSIALGGKPVNKFDLEGSINLVGISISKEPMIGGGCDSNDVGNIVIFDNETNKKIFIAPENLENYKSSRYTPIGIIVIPFSHNIYGNDEGAMVSIKSMSLTDPDNGSINEEGICFGGYNKLSLTGLQNYHVTASYGPMNAVPKNYLQSPAGYF